MSLPSSAPPPWSPQGTDAFPPQAERHGTWPGPAPRPERDRPWFHVLLVLATLLTTTYVGAAHYQGFLADFVRGPIRFASPWDLFAGGLLYSLPILAILAAHEAGHYLVCRYYGVDATLPYFLPIPLGISGTLGAFIRIRSPIRTKPVLFDMAVAGPIAGFLTLLPFLVFGLAFSRVVPLPNDFVGYELGEPLLFRLLSYLIWGSIPDGYSLNMHPMAFAAWFGLLMTALNLFPIGQLDGGHVSYAVLGRRSTAVTIGTLAVAIGLTLVTTSWIVWTILMLALLRLSGLRHPPTLDDHVPLDRTRLLVAGLVALIFIASFTPTPIQPYELIRPH